MFYIVNFSIFLFLRGLLNIAFTGLGLKPATNFWTRNFQGMKYLVTKNLAQACTTRRFLPSSFDFSTEIRFNNAELERRGVHWAAQRYEKR